MNKIALTCLTLSIVTLTPTLHADLFHRFKIAEGEGSYESGQALCDSIQSSRGNRKTTLCDPIYNASSDQTIMVTDGDQKWHTVEPNHWMAYYSDEIYLIDITVSNADKTMIYSEATVHSNWYGEGLSCNQQICSLW
ncbi:MAG TPA: hypothetical protein DCL40_02635 [Coxiellaceae bacterium]|nr:hypothetical protein [Coxiellaceae bacterium]